jgi:hypothetical protein
MQASENKKSLFQKTNLLFPIVFKHPTLGLDNQNLQDAKLIS